MWGDRSHGLETSGVKPVACLGLMLDPILGVVFGR
jgi:hypothetical protein